ncbi:MAG: type VI secretion lipoprotein TssJ [Planctomycetota bacterium]
MVRLHRCFIIFLAAATLLITGCAQDATFTYKGGLPLNERDGESRTVRVMLFMLKSDKAFSEASEADLWAGGGDKVKEDLVGDIIELDVQPDPKAPLQAYALGKLESGVNFLGIFAQFTNREDGQSRSALIRKDAINQAVVTFAGNGLTVLYKNGQPAR